MTRAPLPETGNQQDNPQTINGATWLEDNVKKFLISLCVFILAMMLILRVAEGSTAEMATFRVDSKETVNHIWILGSNQTFHVMVTEIADGKQHTLETDLSTYGRLKVAATYTLLVEKNRSTFEYEIVPGQEIPNVLDVEPARPTPNDGKPGRLP